MIVRDSRAMIEQVGIRRRRWCTTCGLRIGTREVVFVDTDHDPERIALLETIATLSKVIQRLNGQLTRFLRMRDWDDL